MAHRKSEWQVLDHRFRAARRLLQAQGLALGVIDEVVIGFAEGVDLD